MRILQIHNRYRQPGGEDRVVAAEAELLTENGHELKSFMTQNRKGSGAAGDLALSIWNPSTAAEVREVVDDFEPDVIHAHNTWFRLSPSVLRQERPVVLTLHNFRLICSNAELFRDGHTCRLCLDGSAINGVLHGCYHGRLLSIPTATGLAVHRKRGTYAEHVDLFVALTEFSRYLMIEGGLPGDRIVVKPNFVADPGISTIDPATSGYVAFVGRLDDSKGVSLLASYWKRHHPPYRLIVVGDGPMRPILDGVPGVQLTGWLPASGVDRIIAEARAVVVPSLWFEGQPLVVLEAMARGTPVIASSHGGLGETLHPVEPKLLFEAGDIDSFAKAVMRLEDDELIRRSGIEARRRFEAAHSPATAITALERIYETAISTAAARR